MAFEISKAPPSLRLFAVSGVLAVAFYVWAAVTGRPPVVLPLHLSATSERSAPFSIYHSGLYLILLSIDRSPVAETLGCREIGCKPPPAPLSWSLYRHGRLIARDDLGPANAVDGVVRSGHARSELEMGSVELSPGGGYVLEARGLAQTGQLKPLHPELSVFLHPWDVKEGLGLMVLGLGIALVAVVSGIWSLFSWLRGTGP